MRNLYIAMIAIISLVLGIVGLIEGLSTGEILNGRFLFGGVLMCVTRLEILEKKING